MVEWISLDRWHADRVVIIGDAAHAAPPHMGEGGILAVEDLVLAQELRNADTIQTALQAYEARRRPRVNWDQEQSLDAARAWGFLPLYVTVCLENTAIRRPVSAMNHRARNLERRAFERRNLECETSSTRTRRAHFSLARRAAGAASSSR